jgi:LysM repeat protein
MKQTLLWVCLLCLTGCNLSTDPTPQIRPSPVATKTLSGVPAEFIPEFVTQAATSQPHIVTQAPRVTAAPSATPTPCAAPQGWTEYSVKRGDSLSTIAARTNTLIDTLITGNCLSNPNALKVGQVLLVPPTP